MLRGTQYDDISWYSVFGMNFKNITHTDIRRANHFYRISFYCSKLHNYVPIEWGIRLFITFISFEIIIGLFSKREQHDHDEGRQIGKQESNFEDGYKLW